MQHSFEVDVVRLSEKNVCRTDGPWPVRLAHYGMI